MDEIKGKGGKRCRIEATTEAREPFTERKLIFLAPCLFIFLPHLNFLSPHNCAMEKSRLPSLTARPFCNRNSSLFSYRPLASRISRQRKNNTIISLYDDDTSFVEDAGRKPIIKAKTNEWGNRPFTMKNTRLKKCQKDLEIAAVAASDGEINRAPVQVA